MKTPKSNNATVDFLKNLFELGFENTGMFYSLYRGIVADNDDPENLQRLKLIIPQVSGNDSYNYWAFPMGVFYGKEYGAQIVPQKGDMVWVQFEGGRPEIPVWSHGHPARKEMSSKDPELKDKNCYWFISPKGFKVKINDTKNTITIETPFGSFIQMNEQSISLVNGKVKNISLGKLDKSTYSAVLGEKNKEVLEDIETIINKLHAALLKDVGTLTGLGLVNIAKEVPLQTVRVKGLKDKIDKILSILNTLE